MKITDEMIKAYGKAWHATPKGAPGDRTRAGLTAALKDVPDFAAIKELEKHPRCTDSDGDTWEQKAPGVWALSGEWDNEVMSTQRLLDSYDCKGFGQW